MYILYNVDNTKIHTLYKYVDTRPIMYVAIVIMSICMPSYNYMTFKQLVIV